MSNPWPHDERAFGDLLRQEARATEPKFSEPLHQSICQAVRQFKADQISIQPAGSGRVRLWWAPLAVTVFVLAAIFARRADNPAQAPEHSPPPALHPNPITIAHLHGAPSLPGLVDRAAIEVDRLISDKLVAEQLTYLEHDARVLANAVTGGSLRRFVQPAAHAREPGRGRTPPEG